MKKASIITLVKIAVRHDIAQLVVLGLKNYGLLTEKSEQQYQQLIYNSVYGNLCEEKVRFFL